jgi:hypothetical protein
MAIGWLFRLDANACLAHRDFDPSIAVDARARQRALIFLARSMPLAPIVLSVYQFVAPGEALSRLRLAAQG